MTVSQSTKFHVRVSVVGLNDRRDEPGSHVGQFDTEHDAKKFARRTIRGYARSSVWTDPRATITKVVTIIDEEIVATIE